MSRYRHPPSWIFYPARTAHSLKEGFSLFEVAVAVGIFAIGVVGVIALISPVSRAVAINAEAESAVRAADVMLTYLRTQPFAAVAGFLKSAEQFDQDNRNFHYNPATDGRVFAVSPTCDKLALVTETSVTVWPNGDRDKFYEITLIRNEVLSPAADDASAPVLAFILRIRWPLFLPAGLPAGLHSRATQVGATDSNATVPFDHGQKEMLFCAGSIRR
ncbi:MAG: hypothetical protein PHQ04_08815 [Opitutaceae bacterium]|nr:hypothetical protein [Opitutaceae bacterium]